MSGLIIGNRPRTASLVCSRLGSYDNKKLSSSLSAISASPHPHHHPPPLSVRLGFQTDAHISASLKRVVEKPKKKILVV